ncbi:MAG: J domain-containing protein [Aquabacterium sp.]|nr:J domain-containing protein [Aquabacterium sp.]
MNHYERLKVSQDAPPEVIRAAYRALAAKLHPDRQQQGGMDTGPDDAMHAQMAALNQAYEVLIDPKLRVEYDATLAPSRPTVAAPASHEPAASASDNGPSTRVDMEWLTPKPAASTLNWPPSRRTMVLGGGLVAAVVLLGGGWLYKMEGQHRVEQALSGQYAQPGAADDTAPIVVPGAAPGAAPSPTPADVSAAERLIEQELAAAEKRGKPATTTTRRPSVEELSRMSDEELLKVLPTLDGQGAAPEPAAPVVPVAAGTGKRAATSARAPTASANHPLDGKPLGLRTDMQLPEALASQQAAAKGKR